jgi:anti-sigma B factor antagonist
LSARRSRALECGSLLPLSEHETANGATAATSLSKSGGKPPHSKAALSRRWRMRDSSVLLSRPWTHPIPLTTLAAREGEVSVLNIIKNRVSDVTVLDIQGVIKLGESAREFSSYLEKVLNDETGPVMINFEAINYMDSTGLGELIGYLQKFEDRQRKMALVKPSHRILALLKITKLDTVFKIFDSRETAMTYLTEPAA